MAASPPTVEVRAVSKHFGGIQAVKDVTIPINAGQVRGLVGANGAGKTTVIKMLAGVHSPDEGEILVGGVAAVVRSPQDSADLAWRFIHQELNLVNDFTVLQNMALGYPAARRHGALDLRKSRIRATQVLDSLAAPLDMDGHVRDLSVSERWMVALGSALMAEEIRLIAMDEPTASFADDEAERLFEIVRGLTSSGVAVLYVSHRLEEVLEICDAITVMRGGVVVADFARGEIDRDGLTRAIVGHDVDALTPSTAPRNDTREVVLAVNGVSVGRRVRSVTLEAKRGEVLGIAGLVGAGRTELARVIFGADQPTSGSMTLKGHPYTPKSPFDAIRQGVALVPEERRSEGLLLHESVGFNINLATNNQNVVGRWFPLLSGSKFTAGAAEMVRNFAIKVSSIDQPVSDLSGGNQQKVVVSKNVKAKPAVLLLDEPTVGVDVGARAEIYRIIRQLAQDGTCVVVISSDFDELLMCDRVAVMSEGRIVDTVSSPDITKALLTALCFQPWSA